MIQGKLLSFYDNLEQVNIIRKQVLVEELKIPEQIVFDENDKNAIFVLVYEESNKKNGVINNPVATGRIIYDGDNCIIDNIAVLKEYRQKKYGDFTVRMLINKAFTSGISEITVNTFPELLEFYSKIGFIFKENTDNQYYKCIMMLNQNNVKTKCCNMK